MKGKKTVGSLISLLGVLLLLTIIPFTAYAAVPQTITYQGYLTDSGGNPIDGTRQMIFGIYDVPSAGTALWTEIQSSVDVNEGVYSVVLGSANPINLAFDIQYYLGVKVGTDPEMTPRQELTSVPYAFRADEAGYAYDVSNNAVTSAKIADGAVTSTDVGFNYAGSSSKGGPASDLNCTGCVSQGELDFTPGDITAVNPGTGLTGGGTSGSVTLNVSVPLQLSGTGTGIVQGTHSSSGNYGYLGSSTYGVKGSGSSAGVYGYNNSSAKSGYLGESDYGVSGYNSIVTSGYLAGSDYGVYGYNISGNLGWLGGSNYGVKGSSTNNGDGVYGVSISGSGVNGESTDGTGVYGFSENDWGVSGFNSNGNYGYMGSSDYGAYGRHSSSGNYGYVGGSDYGVFGSHDANGNNGILGGDNAGVSGYNSANGFGVRGVGGSSSSIGVWGWSNSGTAIKGLSNNGDGIIGSGGTGQCDFDAIGAGTNYCATSSIRWKRGIEEIDNALDKVMNIRGVYFNWDEEHGGRHDMGFIAEEVGEYIPEIVNYEEDGVYANGIDYGAITPMLVQAIKEQQEQIEQLKAEIAELKKIE